MASYNSIAWPAWVLRFIASDEQEALIDAINAVGGSPPYGGVSYEEAEAVYNLLEDYAGPGMAKPKTYNALRRFVRKTPYRQDVLDLFHVNDQITSDPDVYTMDMINRGAELCKRLNHEGVYALFLEYRAMVYYRQGKLAEAIKNNNDALRSFLTLADQDPIYGKRAAQCAQNAISFLAQSGDERGAWALKRKLDPILDGFEFTEEDFE